MTSLQIPTAEVFELLLQPARYKGAHGGRGSGKSHFFAGLMVETALMTPGFRGVCIREVQKDLKDSAKRLIEDKIAQHGLGEHFDTLQYETRTAKGGVIIYQGMQDHTAESIKSLEGFDVAWVEEAHSLSQRSLTLLRPTIRKETSELWFSWNPTRRNDPVDVFLRGEKKPSDAQVIRANWSDNPWFPKVLEKERLEDQKNRPEMYPHIWEGDYERIAEGAYYAADLLKARAEGRIGKVPADPLMTIRLFIDIGGTGMQADAFVIWAAQFIGREIRWLDYYEAIGQSLGAHLQWMRERGYVPGRAQIWLPHDGRQGDKVFSVTYESAFRENGYDVTVVPNMGTGAFKLRIETARRHFGAMWFNEETTSPGLDALGAYHEKRDDRRNIGLGAHHDWASHAADAFGMGAVVYEAPDVERKKRVRDSYRGEGAWMG